MEKSKNSPKAFGAQSLRLRQALEALWPGSLAVPRQKRLAGPALPLGPIASVLLEASAIRASRLWGNSCIFFIFLLLTAGCATRPPRVTVVPTTGYGGITHTLVKGETIWRLAETYGVKAGTILKANRIKDPSSLKVGTPIWIPGVARSLRTLPFLPEASRWKYLIIHHSATEVGNAELFDKGHRRRGFWNGLGYHFVIDNGTAGTRDGQIETSHRWIHQMDGAHCNAMDMNQKGIGICLVGNFDNERVSEEQLVSLVWLVRQLQAKYGIPKQRVLQHNDVPGKNGTHCPGRNFPWSKFRKQLL